MGKNNHSIELSGRQYAPRHTAFNWKCFFETLPITHVKRSFLNWDKPPPKQKDYPELLNVLYRTIAGEDSGISYSLFRKIIFRCCRAPPCQELQL